MRICRTMELENMASYGPVDFIRYLCSASASNIHRTMMPYALIPNYSPGGGYRTINHRDS